MDKRITIYDKDDPRQYTEDKEFWKNKTPKEKLDALEAIRGTWSQLNQDSDEHQQGLQRVFQIIER